MGLRSNKWAINDFTHKDRQIHKNSSRSAGERGTLRTQKSTQFQMPNNRFQPYAYPLSE
jgi:hypothetical protein